MAKVTGITRKTMRPARFVAVIEAILRRAGKPMTRTELTEAVEKEGVEIPSVDKPRYLGTILWREREKFENVGGEGYWLKGVRIPTTPAERIELAAPLSVGGIKN